MQHYTEMYIAHTMGHCALNLTGEYEILKDGGMDMLRFMRVEPLRREVDRLMDKVLTPVNNGSIYK